MIYFVLILLVFLLVVVSIIAFAYVIVVFDGIRGWRSCGPWVGTRFRALNEIVKLIGRYKKKPFILYDIGSGDGRVSFSIAKAFPEDKIIGIDFSKPLFVVSKMIKRLKNIKNVQFWHKDIFECDLSDADFLYCYNLPGILNAKLGEKFKRELKQGAIIISYDFQLKILNLKEEIIIPNNCGKLFVYEM